MRLDPQPLASPLRRPVTAICLLALLTLALTGADAALAKEKITGAFGYSLGKKLEDAAGLAPEEAGFLALYPKPGAEHRPFELIKVRVAPKSKIIVDISGAVLFQQEEEADKTMEQLKQEFLAKYGKPETKSLYRSSKYVYTQGKKKLILLQRFIALKGVYLIYANYMDMNAYKKAKKEMKKSEK